MPMSFQSIRHSDGIVMAAVVEKYVRYFRFDCMGCSNLTLEVLKMFFISCRSIQHHCQWYFAKFLVCETLNFLFLFLNFWATDQGILSIRVAMLSCIPFL